MSEIRDKAFEIKHQMKTVNSRDERKIFSNVLRRSKWFVYINEDFDFARVARG